MPDEATPEMPSSEFRQGHTRTEHQEQVSVIQWADALAAEVPELSMLHAIPNGGARHQAIGGKLKAEGVRRGVPDLCLPVPTSDWSGLYIEMKRRQGGRVRKTQRWWIEQLREQGYRVEVCRGSDEAIEVLTNYLEIDE